MKKNSSQIKLINRSLILLITFLFVFSLSTAFAQAKKTDYTGTWTLNENKSQLGEGPGRRAASKMVITQDDKTLNNEKTSTRQSGETITAKEKYNLDGSETDNSQNDRKKKSIASWSADMKDLTINSTTIFERDGNSMEIKTTEIYKLGSDGISLIIETTSSSSFGEFKTSLFYDKAK
jgi:hypothetical protein